VATLEVQALSRDFRVGSTTLHVLRGVDLSIERGSIVGLLGVNGAGKTTLLKIVSTLLLPTAGTVRVGGFDVVREARAARRLLSVVFGGERGFYGRLSARENATFFAVLSGLTRREAAKRAQESLERMGLADAADRPVETFSRGMKQRLHLAVGLVRRPQLLMLDEPTIGLDPLEAQRLRESIAELRGSDVAVLLTSHYLGDIERLCSRVAILQRGRITYDLPPEQLLARTGAAAEIRLSGTGPAPRQPEGDRFAASDGIRFLGHEAFPDGAASSWTMSFEVKEWSADALRALAASWPAGEITDVRVLPASLEQVFAELAAEEETP